MNIYIETYGCQMNLNDSEIISSILFESNHKLVNIEDEADVIFLNTCSVRDNAERKIRERLVHLKPLVKKNPKIIIGIIGCMAERLRGAIIEKNSIVKIVAGPDEYRNLPKLIDEVQNGNAGIAVKLSRTETYDDIVPIRADNGISGFLSITRGCNNFCSYCVVPYTRGRERSRSRKSIINEIERMNNEGYKEITLLGQNVNSYLNAESNSNFPILLELCAKSYPNILFRFTTSHPKDTNKELIHIMAKYDNICNHLHLPVQSGSTRILEAMNRKYTAEEYLKKVEMIKSIIPDIALTTDIISGYVGETIEDHQATLDLMKIVQYDSAFMFKYSPRSGTKAFKLVEKIDENEKIRRLNEIIAQQQEIATKKNKDEIGKIHNILVENVSRRNKNEWKGRTKTNKPVIFPIKSKNSELNQKLQNIKAGDEYRVKIISATSTTLKGEII